MLAAALLASLALALAAGAAADAPAEQITWAVHTTLVPMHELAFVNGVGRRVDEPGLGLIAGYAFSAPYEDLRLKAK